MSQNINVYFLFFHFDIKSFSRYKISFLYKIVTDVFDVKKVKKKRTELQHEHDLFCVLFEKKRNKIKNKKSRHLPKLRHLTRPVKKLKIA